MIKDRKIIFKINNDIQTWIGIKENLLFTHKKAIIIEIKDLKNDKISK
jgi:hypothetical protein